MITDINIFYSNYTHPYIYPLKKTKYLMSKHNKVYFITDRRYVKIGKTQNIISRLSALQTGHPEKLYVLGYVDGGRGEEKKLHKRFSKYRVRGEWFKLTEEFAQKIKDLCKREYKKRVKTSMKGNTNGNGRNQYSKEIKK